MVDYINKRLNNISISGIRRYTALALAQKDCISLTIGQPDIDTPWPVQEAAINAIRTGNNHYTTNQGEINLRRCICEYEANHRGIYYSPEEIIITAGGTEAIYCALTGILDPGDEVIIPVPAFGLYETVVKLSGATPIYLDTSHSNFRITYGDLIKRITPRTKALVLNSPNNPTGIVYTHEEIEEISCAVGDKPIFILCDDVYRYLCQSPCPDIALMRHLRNRLLIAQSFSKPWAMTGWRVGYLLGDNSVIEKLNVLHGHTITCAASVLQIACETALKTDISDVRKMYGRRRELVLNRMREMGLYYPEPQGAFFVFPDISSFGLSSEDFCRRMITEARVAAVPGSCFGTEGHIRLSYCSDVEKLKLGMDRLEWFLNKLAGENKTELRR